MLFWDSPFVIMFCKHRFYNHTLNNKKINLDIFRFFTSAKIDMYLYEPGKSCFSK